MFYRVHHMMFRLDPEQLDTPATRAPDTKYLLIDGFQIVLVAVSPNGNCTMTRFAFKRQHMNKRSFAHTLSTAD